jgi:hypothetical protein
MDTSDDPRTPPSDDPESAAGHDSQPEAPVPAVAEQSVGPDRNNPDEQLVDPEVSRRKFVREVASFRAMEKEYIKRGWLMIQSEYPEVVVLFAAAHLSPRAVIAGVRINFFNYDLWPPSVQFVDPFTLEPLRAEQMPFRLWKRPLTPPIALPEQGVPLSADHAALVDPAQPAIPQQIGPFQIALQVQSQPQTLVQAHADGKPFLCIEGVREYHNHPFHSNDPWLAHRGTTRGTLLHILNVIHTYGIAPLKGFDMALNVIIGAPVQDPNQIPA